MKIYLTSLIACCIGMLFITDSTSAQNSERHCKTQKLCMSNCQSNPEMAGIMKTIEYYVEGGRKGNSKITAKAFTDNATMSWSENGQIKTVPIKIFSIMERLCETHIQEVSSIILCALLRI